MSPVFRGFMPRPH